MEDKTIKQGHKITLSNRNTGIITGVIDVLSFDADEIVLETELGMLSIKGLDLHVNRLSVEKGEVDIDGEIESIMYSNQSGYGKSGGSLLGRLFR
ncbi:sporulation protein YabP [Natranaerovirga pectinivora]|uniref:Sporulation protein YabP n=1 Tax=Natranaerovirga pectinivora TaxID=682400 RepID=A0A4R3MGV3_9FIRM|nr:sporulation protein YabP [Natranaerovirga pectinivora]TCT13051.1 sporulation protein YabP [Natranaerovirga pectinivora]